MKTTKAFVTLTSLCICLALVSCASPTKNIPMAKRASLAIVPIKSSDTRFPVDSEDKLAAELLDTNVFKVIERDRLDALMQEQELSLTGLTESSVGNTIKLKGADGLVFVNVKLIKTYSEVANDTAWNDDYHQGWSVNLTARIVNAISGELMAAANVTGKAEAGVFFGDDGQGPLKDKATELIAQATDDAMKQLAKKLAEQQ